MTTHGAERAAGQPVSDSLIMSSPPKPRKTSENSCAPITTTKTIEVMWVVERITSIRMRSR